MFMFLAAFGAQNYVAGDVCFVAGGVCAVDHQMIVAGSSVGGNLYFVVMDSGIFLSR
jgi:hypothetical protein